FVDKTIFPVSLHTSQPFAEAGPRHLIPLWLDQHAAIFVDKTPFSVSLHTSQPFAEAGPRHLIPLWLDDHAATRIYKAISLVNQFVLFYSISCSNPQKR